MSNLIERFAPYPKTEDEATAENVYRYLLVAAYLTNLRQVRPFTEPGGPSDPHAHATAAARFVAEWSTLHLLRKLLGYRYTDGSDMPDTADGVVRDMWGAWDDGEDMAPALWEWLVQAGLDPDEIEKAYDEATAGG